LGGVEAKELENGVVSGDSAVDVCVGSLAAASGGFFHRKNPMDRYAVRKPLRAGHFEVP
jgi:hypothetical protein